MPATGFAIRALMHPASYVGAFLKFILDPRGLYFKRSAISASQTTKLCRSQYNAVSGLDSQILSGVRINLQEIKWQYR